MSNLHTARPQPVDPDAQVNTRILMGEIPETVIGKTLSDQSY